MRQRLRNPIWLTAVAASLMVLHMGVGAAQPARLAAALPMRHIEACRVRPTVAAQTVTAVGRFATYRIDADQAGVPVELRRTAEFGYGVRLVQIDAFELCIRRWRFGGSGVYELQLWGGTTGVYRVA